MDIREFSNKLAEATKNMSEEERAALMKMFERVSDDIAKLKFRLRLLLQKVTLLLIILLSLLQQQLLMKTEYL